MKFGSLFSGIGGIDLGLERAGMECAWQVEIDDYCTRVLEKNWPDVPRFKDVREVGAHNLQPVDLIAGGFPCQPFSVAGKQRGKEDDRYLWPEMLRVIRDVHPTWVLGENVAGLVSMGLDQVLSDLEGEGYTCQAFVIPACGVDAPHRRDRVWIIANTIGDRCDTRRTKPKRQQGETFAIDGGEVLANSTCEMRDGARGTREARGLEPADRGDSVADTDRERESQPKRNVSEFGGWAGDCSEDVSHAGGQRLEVGQRSPRQRAYTSTPGGSRWAIEPNVGRVAHGIPNRVDRLKCLGNAVVPQVVTEIGRAIMGCR